MFSCNNVDSKIKCIENDYNISFPNCYNSIEDSSWSGFQDFTIELDFEFDHNCFQLLMDELEKNNTPPYLYEDNVEYSWTNEKDESSTLTLETGTRKVKYLFIKI
jgi:hypothetical protein